MATNLNAPPARVTAATVAAAKTAGVRDAARLVLDELKLDMAALDARKAVLERVLKKERGLAWCADLTEDAAGEVATMDLPDEGKLVVIAPTARAPVATDGSLALREAMSGPQAYWCAAALPGVQKWRPQYRRGTVTALNTSTDMADVTLESTDTSSADGLGINRVSALKGVPVVYMTCNAQAFEVGDKCVVEFIDRDQAKPRVVGFVDNPRACDTPDLHLIFWEPDVPRDTDVSVRIKSAGGLNYSGRIEDGGVYLSVGLALESARVTGGMRLDDTSLNVSYWIPVFYDGFPVLRRRQTSIVSTTEILSSDPAKGEIAYHSIATQEISLRWHNQVYANGSWVNDSYVVSQLFQPPFSSVPNSVGDEKRRRSSEVFSNYLGRRGYGETELVHPAAMLRGGPWAGWSALAGYVYSGTFVAESVAEGEPVTKTDSVSSPWQAWSLPPPKKNAASKARADLAQMPARLATSTVRAYASASFASAPLDRHLLDFGYLPYTCDTLKVYAVGKTIAWCWMTNQPMPGGPGQWVNIAAVNYKTGVTVNISAPQFWTPNPLPLKHIPPNVVLADTWAVLAKNDPIDAYFWVWYYALDMAAGTLSLTKTITNKPGDLSAGGHVGLVQVVTPNLPAGAVLVGAMRDELACM